VDGWQAWRWRVFLQMERWRAITLITLYYEMM
jgi:hypothetical protein